MQLSVTEALQRLRTSGHLFTNIFEHGSLTAEIYKPARIDFQQPHNRDEICVIAGTGQFYHAEAQ